ncbi:uncharacterized protein LOC121055592 [Oryza brachyantha]|uniref:uncharacterized protein LOC121055592 n=1 Tax=Oryza brachyantha TaxID=4533 RepID=UPI001ADA922C|nr:uncharacterized protein LOC121055592 [Oryza brachyantha]
MAVASATSTAAEEEVVLLRCFDRTRVPAPAGLAAGRSALVAAAAAAAGGGAVVVDVPGNVCGVDVAAAVAYWKRRAAAADGDAFDGEFIGGLTHDARIELIVAAHHLADNALFALLT